MKRFVSGGLALALGSLFLACSSSSKSPAAPAAEPTPDAETPEQSDAGTEVAEKFRALDAYLAKATKDLAFQSASFGVLEGRELAFVHGYGIADEKTGAAVTRDTVYRVGSITKVMTATVVLQLRDEGKLDLDDPLEKYLPEAKAIVYPNGAADPRVTLGQILTHRSGMPRLGEVDYTTGKDVTEEQLLGELDGLVLENVPGTHSEYSNLAVSLLGPVIARVTKTTYEDAMQERLLDPLGMKSVWRREDAAGPLALGHHVSGKKVETDPTHWRLGAMEAAGGLYTSIDDLFRFARFGLEGPESGTRPLSLTTLREAQTVQDGSKESQARGWIWVISKVSKGRWVWHNGSTVDYSSTMWLDPERHIGVVGLTAASDSKNALDNLVFTVMEHLALGKALE